MRTLIVGLGNPLLGDDGVGVRVAELVRKSLPPHTDVEVCEASVGGLRLMEMMLGYDRVILIDALLTTERHPPGTYHRLSLEDLREIRPTAHSTSVHDTSLTAAWDLAWHLGLPLPAEAILYGICVREVTHFKEELTPQVADAIPKIAAAVLSELE